MNHVVPGGKKDLIVLVADKDQKVAIDCVLKHRFKSLGIREIEYDIYSHQERDPGVYRRGSQFLAGFTRQYRLTLVVLDAQWDGTRGAEAIREKIQQDLDRSGWKGRGRVIVIDPELEAWIWSPSSHVYEILGMSRQQIEKLGKERGWWTNLDRKPDEPKRLYEEILYRTRKRKSSAWFGKLAIKVGLETCADPSFKALKDTLREWFPAEKAS